MNRIKSLLYKLGYPVAKLYWFFRRPVTAGVRCLVLHGDQILLIRHTYGNPLRTTVGGGIKTGETLAQAVIRETKEEVGITLESVTKIGELLYKGEYKRDTIHVFITDTDTCSLDISNAEIAEAGWFPLESLPADVSPLFRQFLELATPYIHKQLPNRIVV